MRTANKAVIAFLLVMALVVLNSRTSAASFECDPDDMWNQDCGPYLVCDPGTLTCAECNHNPSQCEPGWVCPVAEPSACAPIN
jgi:hypothetical protein